MELILFIFISLEFIKNKRVLSADSVGSSLDKSDWRVF